MIQAVNRYAIKRKVMRPVTAWRRWRLGPTNDFNRAVFESHDYRPAMQRFFATARDRPDILHDVDLPAGGVALDVGAYRGQWTERVLARAEARGQRDVTVHLFEPEPSSVAHLRAHLGDDPRVHVHPFGLGGTDRTLSLGLGGPGSSLYKDGTTENFLGATEVPVRDVGAVLDSLGLSTIELMMVNIEGGEFELIDRLHESGWLGRLGTLFVQFHEFGPDAYRGRRRNRRQLAETHDCTWSYPWVFERWDRRA